MHLNSGASHRLPTLTGCVCTPSRWHRSNTQRSLATESSTPAALQPAASGISAHVGLGWIAFAQIWFLEILPSGARPRLLTYWQQRTAPKLCS